MATHTPSRWNLNDLFPSYDSPEIKETFTELKAKIKEFEKNREKLKADMDIDEFLSIITTQENLYRKVSRLGQFAGLWLSEDTQNQEAIAFQAQVQQFLTELQNSVLFFSLWWKSLSNEEVARFTAHSGEFTYWLDQIRKYKPFTLSEPEEKIINIKDVTGVNAIVRLYSTLTNRYVFKVDVNGEEKEYTRGELMTLVQMNDPNIREQAYKELYRVFGNDGLILGQIYQSVVRDFYNENIDLRGYKSPISWRNLNNDIPDEVVNALLDVAQKNTEIFQRYFKLKAKWLKMEKLRRYDIYAPVTSSDKRYDYNNAVELVLKVFQKFNPKMADLARRIFEKNHIDSEVRKNKRTGAFCSSSDPALTPFVLTNYNGKASDIATLAHELGHAIHAMLAEHHNAFNYHSTLPLAETASTFSEMLLIDELLSIETDEEIRRDILFQQIADNYATIMRQIFFALFEQEAHKLVIQNASVDDLSKAYMQNLQTQFGDSLEISEEFKWEWVSIPHIYRTPFYVYAYSFGQLLVLALYNKYRKEGKKFISQYLKILSAGGSKSPVSILDEAGINVRTHKFWQGGFDIILDMISKLEDLPITN